MSTALVLDASAAARAVMESADQPALLDRLTQASLVPAPALLRAEAANALWKYQPAGVITTPEALIRHHEVLLLVHRFVDDQVFYPEALHWSAETGHPVYDALYALTARRHGATVLTCDKRLHAACAGSRIASEHFAS